MIINKKNVCFFPVLLIVVSIYSQEKSVPFKVSPLFIFEQPKTLGLSFAEGLETFTIFSPNEGGYKYNNGLVLFPFKGMLYAQWQSSSENEDAADTQIFYSKSTNGKDWCKPIELTKKGTEEIKTSGGWWSDGTTLIAYIDIWPDPKLDCKQGYTHYISSTDGVNWSSEKPIVNKKEESILGIIEQDVHALPNGRIITAFHLQPGLNATPFYTDDPLGISAWNPGAIKINSTENPCSSRGIEPSWFYRNDGAIVMIFRDQKSSFKKLASLSLDNGVTWTTPEIVDTPDSRAKQSAGNLPNGIAYMVNNPSGNKDRFPLVITLSKDGFLFNKAFLIRSGGQDLQAMRFQGKYKRVGYNYPKSMIWGNYLYIGYATNKEDVEVSRIPLDSLYFK